MTMDLTDDAQKVLDTTLSPEMSDESPAFIENSGKVPAATRQAEPTGPFIEGTDKELRQQVLNDDAKKIQDAENFLKKVQTAELRTAYDQNREGPIEAKAMGQAYMKDLTGTDPMEKKNRWSLGRIFLRRNRPAGGSGSEGVKRIK